MDVVCGCEWITEDGLSVLQLESIDLDYPRLSWRRLQFGCLYTSWLAVPSLCVALF
jgi:hypothetical protein